MSNAIDIMHLSVQRNDRMVLQDINLSIASGCLFGIVGPNSAGKTTLLKCMTRLLTPQQGDIALHGRPLQQYSAIQLARTLAYMPQSQEIHWPLSVFDVVALGRLPHHSDWSHLSPTDHAIVRRCLRDCEIEHLVDRNITELSGGEVTRVLLARTLAVESDIIIADEPISHLDPYYQISFMQLLQDLAAQGKTVIVVLHDLTLAARFCERIGLFDQQRLVREGPPQDVLTQENIKQVYSVELLAGDNLAGATGFAPSDTGSTAAASIALPAIVLPWRCLKPSDKTSGKTHDDESG